MAIVELQFGVICDSFCPFFAERILKNNRAVLFSLRMKAAECFVHKYLVCVSCVVACAF